MDKIEFVAAIAPVKTAIAIDGMEACTEIKLQAPGTEIAQVVRLLLLIGKRLRITIVEDVE